MAVMKRGRFGEADVIIFIGAVMLFLLFLLLIFGMAKPF